MRAKTLMIMGSMSSVGKSLLVTGLCRMHARQGLRVLPFKAQNMSNNAAVCSGGEIGRAQAVQAYAAGVVPTVEMNPVLIKPVADQHGQVIVRGQVWDIVDAVDYYTRRAELWRVITGCLDELRASADLVVIEGAGSPAEMNLREGDIVNMAVARYARSSCLLVGDIDRGGIFAQLLGTLQLLEAGDRALFRGLIVNKFRGAHALFADGVRILEERSGLPVLGVLPFIQDVSIAEEDAAALGENLGTRPDAREVAVVSFPHISNFDDLDPLRLEPGVQLRFVKRAGQLGNPAAVILPGSKNTRGDLAWLRQEGLADAIRAAAGQGAAVVGLCGGFQMLGREVIDQDGVESAPGREPGLGLLPVRTWLEGKKTVTHSRATVEVACGFWRSLMGSTIEGYEIHMGRTETAVPLLRVTVREGRHLDVADGAHDPTGRIFGTYLHGLFDNDNLRRSWLRDLGVTPGEWRFAERRQQAYDRLADVLEASLDTAALDRILNGGTDR